MQAFVIGVVDRDFKPIFPWLRLRLNIPIEKKYVRPVGHNGLGFSEGMTASIESNFNDIFKDVSTDALDHTPYAMAPEAGWRSDFHLPAQQRVDKVSVVSLQV
jgi:hypothetical protein